MGSPENKQNNSTAFQSGPLEDLTIQDGLIISAVYAVQTDTEKCNQLKEVAQKHPLFVEEPEKTSARVNKFTNLMQGGQSLKAIEAVARSLKPAHRKQAFEFALEAAMADAVLTEKKKKILQTLATKLALDNAFVEQKLAAIEDKSGR
jgi:predicted PP-loop superfamily ATPase